MGSSPLVPTRNALLVQWIVHESSKLRMIVRFYQRVLRDGDVDYRLGRNPFKVKDKVQVLTSLLNGVIY